MKQLIFFLGISMFLLGCGDSNSSCIDSEYELILNGYSKTKEGYYFENDSIGITIFDVKDGEIVKKYINAKKYKTLNEFEKFNGYKSINDSLILLTADGLIYELTIFEKFISLTHESDSCYNLNNPVN
ncbi:hypothetical protein OO013_07965 [Mangrovivirga sp. M17]|uniref:Lipoprotein n=1 Tax=Mangrovivirga halotolerans TaxID=2993936 RepID=A0ABT3RQM6_9BACT|nr:hypothetical protein [Mangrovivirga halotolerans]MCX2743796.1 hypothetical protein [Mangrovivirga halotolerans]